MVKCDGTCKPITCYDCFIKAWREFNEELDKAEKRTHIKGGKKKCLVRQIQSG